MNVSKVFFLSPNELVAQADKLRSEIGESAYQVLVDSAGAWAQECERSRGFQQDISHLATTLAKMEFARREIARLSKAEEPETYVPAGDVNMMYADHQAEVKGLKELLTEIHAMLADTNDVSIYAAVSTIDNYTRNSQWWVLSLRIGEWCKRAAHALGLVDVKKGG